MDKHAEDGHPRDRDQESKREWPTKTGVKPIDRVHPAHDEIGIGNPNHIDDAEYEVETEREQRQDAAEQEPIDHRFDEVDVHPGYSPI